MKLSRTAVRLHGALAAYLIPKLAADKAFDVTPLLVDVTAKNAKDKRAAIIDGVKKGTATLLAADAKLDDLPKLLERLPLAADEDDDDKKRAEKKADDAESEKFLKDKLSAEDYDAYAKARDAEEEAEEKRAKEARDTEEKDADKVSKKAMDEAITAAVKTATETTTKNAVTAANQNAREIVEATQFVRPWVGDLSVACDSAEAVYRTALGTLGVAGADKLHRDALKPILQALPKPSDKPRARQQHLAQDAAGAKGFAERFPGADRIVVA